VGLLVSPRPTSRVPLGSHSPGICWSRGQGLVDGHAGQVGQPVGRDGLGGGQLLQAGHEQAPLLQREGLLEPGHQVLGELLIAEPVKVDGGHCAAPLSWWSLVGEPRCCEAAVQLDDGFRMGLIG
jgi:hypothetical protein